MTASSHNHKNHIKEPHFIVIGGGFYGCCLALYLRSLSSNITLIEASTNILERASKANQARIHAGFHYPRSMLTAVKSMVLHERFAADFSSAIVDDFQMLYAISKTGSKISSNHFYRMFNKMGANISLANDKQTAIFNPETVDTVFACRELAFDYTRLREYLTKKLMNAKINICLNTRVVGLNIDKEGVDVQLKNGLEKRATYVFNVTYGHINQFTNNDFQDNLPVKYELAEIALIKRPEALTDIGVTVMDGPFMSTMPYPSKNTYSLTHVKYSPHFSWTNLASNNEVYWSIENQEHESRYRHMLLDSARYIPCLMDAKWLGSLYEVKTLLLKNELDDGRPICYQKNRGKPRIFSVLGGKIDNIYDLFEIIREEGSFWSTASEEWLINNDHF